MLSKFKWIFWLFLNFLMLCCLRTNHPEHFSCKYCLNEFWPALFFILTLVSSSFFMSSSFQRQISEKSSWSRFKSPTFWSCFFFQKKGDYCWKNELWLRVAENVLCYAIFQEFSKYFSKCLLPWLATPSPQTNSSGSVSFRGESHSAHITPHPCSQVHFRDAKLLFLFRTSWEQWCQRQGIFSSVLLTK